MESFIFNNRIIYKLMQMIFYYTSYEDLYFKNIFINRPIV